MERQTKIGPEDGRLDSRDPRDLLLPIPISSAVPASRFSGLDNTRHIRLQRTNDRNPCLLPCIATFAIGFFLRPLPSIYPINIDSCDLCGGSRFVCNPIILVIRYREYGHLVVTEDKVKNQKINS